MKRGRSAVTVLEGFVCHQIHGFDLECLHEALGLGVVVGIAAPAHGAGETVLLQDGAIVFGGILRPTVGMMHATPWWIAGADGGLECSNSEPCIYHMWMAGVGYWEGGRRRDLLCIRTGAARLFSARAGFCHGWIDGERVR